MTLRHKRVVATLDIGTAADWNNDHHLDPSDELVFWTTFVEHKFSDLWDVSQAVGAGEAVVSNIFDHVKLIVNSGAVDADIGTCQLMYSATVGDITIFNDEPVATFSVRIVSASMTSRKIEFGFFASGDSPFTDNKACACFYVADGTIYAKTSDGVNQTTYGIGVWSPYAIYRIKLTSALASFYIDNIDTPVHTISTTLPVDPLTIKLSAKAGASGAATFYCDFVGLTRLTQHS